MYVCSTSGSKFAAQVEFQQRNFMIIANRFQLSYEPKMKLYIQNVHTIYTYFVKMWKRIKTYLGYPLILTESPDLGEET